MRVLLVVGGLVARLGGSAWAQPDAAPAPVEPAPPPDAAPVSPPPPDAAPTPPPEDIAVPAPTPEPAPAPAVIERPGFDPREDVHIHGFVSQGGFVSTDNDYIGASSRGSLELFEAGINFSADLADKLRAGMQLFARDFGVIEDTSPRLDWAYLDYKWRPWLGLRAGIVKMPFGLYNEYADIDSARLAILLPQGVYSFRNRDVLLSHRGVAVYGTKDLGPAGEVDYQALLGTLSIPRNALSLTGANLDSVDTRYVTGAQVMWQPPVEGLRIGGTLLRASIDFHLTLGPELIAALIAAGLVPPDYDGSLLISQRPVTLVVASAEYTRADWLFAAEYSRGFTHQDSSLPMALPPMDAESEVFYAMATHRLSSWLEVGSYYSVLHADAHDRRGRDPKWPKPFYAFQRDLAATVRFDINDHWLWKLEAHFIDGVAALDPAMNAEPERYWGLFMFRTTVTF